MYNWDPGFPLMMVHLCLLRWAIFGKPAQITQQEFFIRCWSSLKISFHWSITLATRLGVHLQDVLQTCVMPYENDKGSCLHSRCVLYCCTRQTKSRLSSDSVVKLGSYTLSWDSPSPMPFLLFSVQCALLMILVWFLCEWCLGFLICNHGKQRHINRRLLLKHHLDKSMIKAWSDYIPSCWVKKARAWSIPASDFKAISSLSRSLKYICTLLTSKFHYWWFVLLKPAPPPSKSASSGLLCDTKTCTLRKVLQCSSKCQWMFSYLHSFKPSMKTMGETRSSRKRLFNRNIWADWSSLQG